MEKNYETILTGYPTVINLDCTKEIINQMEKCICKIKVGEEQGTGFFCKIPFPVKNNILKVLITNNHVINEDILYKNNSKISIYIEEEKQIRELNLNNRIKYTKKKEEYDITIIEIKEDDRINNFLELDDTIVNGIIKNKNENVKYVDKTFYIIQYADGDLSVSYGVLFRISEDKKYEFNHKCSTKGGSSGSPILTLKNKVVGLHTGGNRVNNLGTFLNEPIKDFIKEYNYNKQNNIIKYNSKWEEKNNGLLKLCLLKEISFKLNDDDIKKLPKFVSSIMRSLKNINIKYISDSYDTREEIKEVLYKKKGINVINFSDFLDETLNMEQINELMSFLNSVDNTEINNIKLNLSKYIEQIQLFNEGFEQSKRESIFEFFIISLVLKKREDFEKFKQERKKCPNRIDRLLFHGVSIDPIPHILTGHFKKNLEKGWYGKGVYFSDFLDYCWFYGSDWDVGANRRIPKIGDTFNLIACPIYYDKKGFRHVHDYKYTPKKNEINFAYSDAEFGEILEPDSTKFIGTEYVIFDLDQICPFIGAKLKRNEYCIIWRDNNFSNNKIINDEFKILKKNFLSERIRFIKQFSNYNFYSCETSNEALKLLERKKYNKIILLSNICSNLEGKKFVNNARNYYQN